MSVKSKRGSHLEVIFGPMFSGKTSELIRRIARYRMCGCESVVIRYAKDNRYSTSEVATHDGVKLAGISAIDLFDILDVISKYDVIGIDEGQFFHGIVEFCKLQLKYGKVVLVAGLDGTYLKQGFGDILGLVPLAMKVSKLSAVCMSCGVKASFSRRICQEKDVEVIGGSDKYMAVCRKCYDSPFSATALGADELKESLQLELS